MKPNPYFHLVFRPNITLVSTVRRFTAEFYRRVLVDVELASRIALATHELLENAVAYSSDAETAIRIELEGDVLTVRTWNRATPERAQAARALIERLMTTPNIEQLYQDLLIETARRSEGSGLGLARVRSEAEMALECEVDQEKLCVRATTKISGGLQQ